MEGEPTVKELLDSMIADVKDPGKLLELYYWYQENGLPQTIRSFMGLTHETRQAVAAFFSMATPSTVNFSIDGAGQITLSCPEISETLQIVKEATEPKRKRA